MDFSSADFAQLVFDRSEITDTLHRYARGLDQNDAAVLASALADDCVFDFTPAGMKLHLAFPVLQGRDEIVSALISVIGPLDTSHSISNVQIEIEGDRATAHAYVMSQHFMPGEGSRRDTENALLMNRYDVELVRGDRKWKMKNIRIDNAWAFGDPGILSALATLRSLRAKGKQAR